MTTITAGISFPPCQHCGQHHSAPCPRIKVVEYYHDGTIKRVEYVQPGPMASGSVSNLRVVADAKCPVYGCAVGTDPSVVGLAACQRGWALTPEGQREFFHGCKLQRQA